MSQLILIYLDQVPLGTLYVDTARGVDVYSFAFDPSVLSSGMAKYLCDPEIGLIAGRQFKANPTVPYHFLLDAMPNRWGRNLIQRKYPSRHLRECDYLLEVSDESRMGALRFKEDANGPFLAKSDDIPPYRFLRELEDAAYHYDDFDEDETWKTLFSPGSSLGGARPKASIYGADGNLYLAKFGHKNDTYDVSAVEYLTYLLALDCGIHMAESRLLSIGENRSVFLTKRFDRTGKQRVPFVSFMTLLNAKEGDSGSYSYLDVAENLAEISSAANEDLHELYRRMVFSWLTNNLDDHLRNHGMICLEGKWVLSPAFDVNISPYPGQRALPFGGQSESKESLIELSTFFRLAKSEAENVFAIVEETIAKKFFPNAKKANLKDSFAMELFRLLPFHH